MEQDLIKRREETLNFSMENLTKAAETYLVAKDKYRKGLAGIYAGMAITLLGAFTHNPIMAYSGVAAIAVLSYFKDKKWRPASEKSYSVYKGKLGVAVDARMNYHNAMEQRLAEIKEQLTSGKPATTEQLRPV